jgi:hypothetical protein
MISATCLRQVSVDAVNRNRYGDRQWPACDVIVPLDGRLAARVFGVVTERSAARVNLSPPLSGIDLVKASSITLSPNSNLLAKCYLALHQTNSGTRLANCR